MSHGQWIHQPGLIVFGSVSYRTRDTKYIIWRVRFTRRSSKRHRKSEIGKRRNHFIGRIKPDEMYRGEMRVGVRLIRHSSPSSSRKFCRKWRAALIVRQLIFVAIRSGSTGTRNGISCAFNFVAVYVIQFRHWSAINKNYYPGNVSCTKSIQSRRQATLQPLARPKTVTRTVQQLVTSNRSAY